MILAQEQVPPQQQRQTWLEQPRPKPIEPERDHPGVEPEDETLHRSFVCKENLDKLPTIKGVRIPTPVFNFSSDANSVEVVNSESWSDTGDDDDSQVSTTPQMIQDSIRAIRDEASRMDSILAMDKLDTLMEELQSIKRELASRNAEMDKQRDIVKLKENRIAMLELERDLYKADNAKLKQDLQCVLTQLQSKSDVSSLTTVQSITDSDRSVDLSRFESDEAPVDTPWDAEGFQLAPTRYQQQSLRSVSPEKYHPSASPQAKKTHSPHNLAGYIALSDGGKSTNVEDVCASNKLRKSCSRMLLKLVMQRQAVDSTTTLLPPCSTSSTLTDFSCLTSNGSSTELQVRDLYGRLKSSMDLCDELRRRLALIGHYYEKLVHRLQSRLERVTSDKEKMETELVVQLSSINTDKPRVFRLLESKLVEKEAAMDSQQADKKCAIPHTR